MADELHPPQAVRVHKGLEGVVAAETRISKVDGTMCRLIYRGYEIGELVGRATYEEVSYLLLRGALPTHQQLAEWIQELDSHRVLEAPVLTALQSLPADANAMALLRSAVSLTGHFDLQAEDDSVQAIQGKIVRTIAKVPTIVAAIGRRRQGKKPIGPKKGLSHTANFLYMLHGKPPSELQTRALDAYLVLLADHGFNASTFTARIVTGTQSDYYSAVAAAIGSLKGPLHGDANRRAMEMLLEIGSVEGIAPYVQQTLAGHKRFMGFGHRVYRSEDPRAKHLKGFSRQLAEANGEMKWYTISEQLQAAVWEAKKLCVNVDFYSASLLYALGIPTALFTCLFACARVAGWSAQIMEQAADNRLIRPLASYVGPENLQFTSIEQRTASISA